MTNVELFKHNLSASLNVKTIFRKVFDVCFLCCGQQLLVILHHIYSVLIILRREIGHAYYVYIHSNISRSKNSDWVGYIEEQVISYEKVPSHMVFILGSESVSYKDIVKVIEWCLPAGIVNISFYSYNNEVEPNLIFEAVCKYARSCIQKIKWGKSFCKQTKLQSGSYINGYLWKPQVTVNVYRREDGLESLLEVVKELHSEGVKTIERGDLSSYLSKRISAPDPDLAVVCGHSLSPYAFLPWHLRITQFYLLDSHHHITVNKFLELLKEYSKCEQRYGK